MDGAPTTEEEGITGFVDTNEVGRDIDNDEEVTRSMHDSEVGVRVGLFPVFTMNLLNSLRIDLHASAVTAQLRTCYQILS